MKLESALKYFNPQGMHLTDEPKGTSTEKLTSSDIIAALGMTTSRARFGVAAWLGKLEISKKDREQVIQALARYAIDTAPAKVRKAAGDQLGRCMLLLAQFAWAEYSRSAATHAGCQRCSGSGLIETQESVVIHPGIYKENGEEVVAATMRQERVRRTCTVCNGKGQVTARCRCGGRGEVLDRKATQEQGIPIFKLCERCKGRGYSTVPSTTVHKAVLKYLPDLHLRTWSRNWKPHYESLIEKCFVEEQQADQHFREATAISGDVDNI